MKFFIRTIILLVVPFQYSGASEMNAVVDFIGGLFNPEFVIQGIEFVIQGISGLCILYLTFCKSYFTEKGKNVATKEDIKSITQEVETVKNALALSTQAKLSLHNEERESLINSWEKMNHWHSVIGTMRLKVEFVDAEYFNKADLELQNAQIECCLAWTRVELVNSNKELARSYSELYYCVHKLGLLVGVALLKNKHLQESHREWSTKYGEYFEELHRDMLETRSNGLVNTKKLKTKFGGIIQKQLKELANNSIEC